MKPGKNDIPVKLKISGRQLKELQKHTWQMCEAFGLDGKIENYKGTRPISTDHIQARKPNYTRYGEQKLFLKEQE